MMLMRPPEEGPTKDGKLFEPPRRVVLDIGPDDLPRIDLKGKPAGPQLPTKNKYWAMNRHLGSTHRSRIATKFVENIRIRMRARGYEIDDEFGNPTPVITDGLWFLEITVYTNRLRDLGCATVPYIDTDAVLSPVKDALEKACLIENDIMIDGDRTNREYRSEPGLRIVLTRIEET